MSANWEQERDAIDHGLRGDKIAFPDLAVAPLGADEQAAGARTPAEHIGRSRRDPDSGPGAGPRGELFPLVGIVAVSLVTAAALVAPLF